MMRVSSQTTYKYLPPQVHTLSLLMETQAICSLVKIWLANAPAQRGSDKGMELSWKRIRPVSTNPAVCITRITPKKNRKVMRRSETISTECTGQAYAPTPLQA